MAICQLRNFSSKTWAAHSPQPQWSETPAPLRAEQTGPVWVATSPTESWTGSRLGQSAAGHRAERSAEPTGVSRGHQLPHRSRAQGLCPAQGGPTEPVWAGLRPKGQEAPLLGKPRPGQGHGAQHHTASLGPSCQDPSTLPTQHPVSGPLLGSTSTSLPAYAAGTTVATVPSAAVTEGHKQEAEKQQKRMSHGLGWVSGLEGLSNPCAARPFAVLQRKADSSTCLLREDTDQAPEFAVPDLSPSQGPRLQTPPLPPG